MVANHRGGGESLVVITTLISFDNINIGNLLMPMFQQAPILPIFDVRCVQIGRTLELTLFLYCAS